MLEYSKPVAGVVGVDATDQFSLSAAPRHGGHCTVLFVDGSVASFEPADIDPADLTIQDRLWKPIADSSQLSQK